MKYTVKPNDTLSGIAEQNNTTVKLLQELNPGLKTTIVPGQVLKMPILLFKKKPVPVAALPTPLNFTEEDLDEDDETTSAPTALPSVQKNPRPVIDMATEPQKVKEEDERIPKAEELPEFEDFVNDLSLIESKYGLPENLLSVLAFLESSGNPAASGSAEAGAKGMFQATPIFLQNSKLKNPYDLVRIPRAAAAYLAHAQKTLSKSKNASNFEGFGWNKEWELAMMAYHAGVQGVLNWLAAGAPLDGAHKNVGKKTLTYAEKTADLMLSGATAQLIEPAWRRFQGS